MDPLFPLVCFFIGAVFFYVGFKAWTIKRLIENTPTSTIRGIAMGFVEIAGTVAKPLNSLLKAPFTGKDCVYFEYKIDEKRTDGKGRSHWVTIRTGKDSVPFYVKDKTGAVLVDPKEAVLELPSDYDQEPFKIPETIKQFCEQNKIATTTWFWSKTLRFVETHLAPNDKVFVLGTAGDNPYVKEATAVRGVEDIMIQKGSKPFYISDTDEKGVLQSFAWKVYGGVYGGGIIIVVSLAVFLWQIGAL